ncbi:MAG TPA: tetratricopeptide repeat protein [Bacteriovoracaceae bacterium]|nr:tetratricopeptide repeat protein [Bacteriovoracaceae bacterium]
MNLLRNRFSFSQLKVSLNKIVISGSDARTFIGSQSTFDVKKLDENEFHLISFLDPQGRILSYGWLLSLKDQFHYFVPPLLKESSLERLNRFLISEDVEIIDTGVVSLYFTLNDPKAPSYKGLLFDQEAGLYFEKQEAIELSEDEIEANRILTGYPLFNPKEFKPEIINNTQLFDLALSRQKGCYPGQETVNKIANNRGAAYYPLLLESKKELPLGEIYSFDKKIGEVLACTQYQDKFFAEAKLLRDFRVEGLSLKVQVKEDHFEVVVRYNPYLKGSNTHKSDELFHEATLAFQRGEITEAENLFKKSIEFNPYNADAYEAYGVMLGRENRFDEAIALMNKLSEIDENSVLAHTNLSMFYMKKGEIEKAEDHKAKATLKSFAQFGKEAEEKARLEQEKSEKLSEWAKREEMFRQVLEIDPEDTLANFGLGTIAVEQGKFQEAIAYLETVLKADPKYSVAYLTLGQAYAGNKQLEKAKEIWREGIKIAASRGDLMPANQMQSLLNQNS